MSSIKISQEILKELLDYNPETGVFLWKKRNNNYWDKKFYNKIAGSVITDHGGKRYIRISIFNKGYAAHRLVIMYVYGYTPNQVDHIDGNGLNNKLSNLRSVDGFENHKNQKMPKTNKSGFVGVNYNYKRSKWEAFICVNSVKLFLGRFNNKDDAIDARKEANIKYGFHENHGQDRPL